MKTPKTTTTPNKLPSRFSRVKDKISKLGIAALLVLNLTSCRDGDERRRREEERLQHEKEKIELIEQQQESEKRNEERKMMMENAEENCEAHKTRHMVIDVVEKDGYLLVSGGFIGKPIQTEVINKKADGTYYNHVMHVCGYRGCGWKEIWDDIHTIQWEFYKTDKPVAPIIDDSPWTDISINFREMDSTIICSIVSDDPSIPSHTRIVQKQPDGSFYVDETAAYGKCIFTLRMHGMADRVNTVINQTDSSIVKTLDHEQDSVDLQKPADPMAENTDSTNQK